MNETVVLRVEQIGIRSTAVRTRSNEELIVPNSVDRRAFSRSIRVGGGPMSM